MSCKRCKLVRWGRHRNGTPRWRCRVCGVTRTREKPRLPYDLVKRYLIDGNTCSQLARVRGVHPDTIRRKVSRVFEHTPPLKNSLNIPQPCWLVTDATHFKRWGCLFVTKATGVNEPLAVSFHDRESFESTVRHLEPLKRLSVAGYTTDGRRGLVLGYQFLFPQAKHQRCLVHVQMKVQTLLTQRPKLLAGQELLALSSKLNQIKSTKEAHLWWLIFCRWQAYWQKTLNERSYLGKSWWYTHRNLRRAWKHVLNAGDNLFIFLEYPNSVSHTNHLEGLFGQRKPALAKHRGLSRKKVAKALLWTFYFLRKKP